MKCQHCEKPATFHVTEITGSEEEREVQEVHLCEICFREYISQPEEPVEPAASLLGALAQQFKIGKTAEKLAKLDAQTCPVCGISFQEFRQVGRLGCPHDYQSFGDELEPLLLNIHGAVEHKGKRPKRGASQRQGELLRLRREMQEAIEREDYERASELRDEIRGREVD
ncbi:MAG: UvrB/UvrC motif-containing protein [Planctomycetes bacterium]|nr:UvrB/UvrC motif-containing protein [Planctomycetota bacterium]